MPCYFDFKCFFVKCPYFSTITRASKSEIIPHLLKHDYVQLLELSVQFKIINNVTERRSPYWLAEQLLDFCNEVNE